MNIDANISQPYNRTRQNQGTDRPLRSKFHFNLNDESINKRKSDKLLDNGAAENLWKMYSKAKELLPYKERMENLTWRMMYVNNHEDYRKVKEHKSESEGNFSSSEMTSSSVSPYFDDFDYKSHIQKMALAQSDNTSNTTINSTCNSQINRNPNSTKKRAADFSPLIASSKPHSNLSASLAAVKKQPLEFETQSAFSFQLDQTAFEGLAANFSESFRSDTQGKTMFRRESRSHTPSFASQNSLLMQMDNKDNSNNDHLSSSFDSHYSSTSPLQTIGPSSILNGFSNGLLKRQNNSMLSLNDQFRSQSNTPFTNQLNNQNVLSFENTGQNPPYPLVHSNSFIIQQSPRMSSVSNSVSQTAQSASNITFDSYDYSTPATSTSYFDNFNKNPFPINSNSFNQNKRINASDTFSSSLPTFLNETFPNEVKNAIKKGKTTKGKKKQTRIVSPDFNGPLSKKEDSGPISCSNCNTTATPLWRRDPQGRALCNACGLFLKLHGVVRPLSLKTDVIKKRQRGPNTSSKKLVSGPTSGDGDDLNPTPLGKTALADARVSPKGDTATSNLKTSPVKKSKPSTRKSSKAETEKVSDESNIDHIDSIDADLDPINEMDYNMDYLNHSPNFSIPNFEQHAKTEGNKSDWDWLGMA